MIGCHVLQTRKSQYQLCLKRLYTLTDRGDLMTTKNIVKEIAYKMNITQDFAKEFVKAYEEVILDALNTGEEVFQRGFMRYQIKTTGGHYHYSYRKQGTVYLPLKYKVVATPTGKLRDSVAEQPVSQIEQRRRLAELETKYKKVDDDGES